MSYLYWTKEKEKKKNWFFWQYDKAKSEKEKIELNALKLNRDLEKVQTELNELKELRGMEDVRGAKEKQEADRMLMELEDIHERFDKSQLEVKNLTEEKERFEVEARKYRNQVKSILSRQFFWFMKKL